MIKAVAQDLRDFTVQIRHATSDAVVGTGIVVAPDGMVATCRHVVRDAVADGEPRMGAVVRVRYTGPSHGKGQTRAAQVVALLPDSDDDVALLAPDRPLLLTADQIAVLGSPRTDGKPHDFKSFGYRRLDSYQAGIAAGRILGIVPPPERGTYRRDPLQIQAEGGTVNRGMSGAGVLDLDLNLVVGMISETWYPDESGKDRDTAWAVDARVLSLEPLGVKIRADPLPFEAAPQPRVVEVAVAPSRERAVQAAWHYAPPLAASFVGRESLQAAIADDWASASVRVTSLTGVGGSGKSALARHAVQLLADGPPIGRPDGLFWWGFHGNDSPDDFLESLLSFISAGRIDTRIVSSSSARAQVIGSMLGSGRYLIVLDNFETVQSGEREQYGTILSPPLAELITYLASPSHTSHTIITSRIEPLELAHYTTHIRRDVGALMRDESVRLLRDAGVANPEEALAREGDQWGGLPMHLVLAAKVLSGAPKPTPSGRGAAAVAPPVPTPPKRAGLTGLLDQLDRVLSAPQRALMLMLSVLRAPATTAFVRLFVSGDWSAADLPGLDAVTPDALDGLLGGLDAHGLCQVSDRDGVLTVHPLARAHFLEVLKQHGPALTAAHECAAAAFLAAYLKREVPPRSTDDWTKLLAESTKRAEMVHADETITDLDPVVEAVYHSAEGGAYDQAWIFYRAYLQRYGLNYLWSRIGAFDTALTALTSLFPNHDLSRIPGVSEELIGTVLNTTAIALENVGRFRDAVALFRRSMAQTAEPAKKARAWNNLANLLTDLAEFTEARQCIDAAFAAIGETDADELYWDLRLSRANLDTVTGQLDEAETAFEEFIASIPDDEPHRVLRSSYVDYLVTRGSWDQADKMLALMADIYRSLGRRSDEQFAHLVRGEVAMARGVGAAALDHLAAAVSAAETGGTYADRLRLITTHGRAMARFGDPDRARGDLDVALRMARQSSRRLEEIEALVGSSWAHRRLGEAEAARRLASIARHMCEETGYYKGTKLVEELEAELRQATVS